MGIASRIFIGQWEALARRMVAAGVFNMTGEPVKGNTFPHRAELRRLAGFGIQKRGPGSLTIRRRLLQALQSAKRLLELVEKHGAEYLESQFGEETAQEIEDAIQKAGVENEVE